MIKIINKTSGQVQPPILKEQRQNRIIKLYHYSNKDFTGQIKPSFFGYNHYTAYSQKVSAVKRTYFYTSAIDKEYIFNSVGYLYIAEINEKDIYDIEQDKDGLLQLAQAAHEDIFSAVKKKGYQGIKGNSGYSVICLFYDISIIKKTELKNELQPSLT